MNISLVDLGVLFALAIVLGIVIHFFITSRRSLKSSSSSIETEKNKQTVDEWKLKYFNEVEKKEQELDEMKSLLNEAHESNHIYKEEIEELRKQQKRSQELGSAQKTAAAESKPNYIEQLRIAQASLLEHNEKINQLLENIEMAKENEEKQKLMEEENEGLMNQIKDLKYILSEKEIEIHNSRQKENLTKEMTSMLDSAYSEFNTLQSKMQKLESQLSSSKMISLEYEDLKEAHIKVLHEYEDYKAKLQAMTAENQQLTVR